MNDLKLFHNGFQYKKINSIHQGQLQQFVTLEFVNVDNQRLLKHISYR